MYVVEYEYPDGRKGIVRDPLKHPANYNATFQTEKEAADFAEELNSRIDEDMKHLFPVYRAKKIEQLDNIKLTEAIKKQIIALRKAGKQHSEIAEAVGLSRSYVNNICLKAGLKSRKWERRTLSSDERDEQLETLSRLLLHQKAEPVITQIGRLVEEMLEAGDGGTYYSDGYVGVCIKPTEIEIVDTQTGTIASLQLHLKN